MDGRRLISNALKEDCAGSMSGDASAKVSAAANIIVSCMPPARAAWPRLIVNVLRLELSCEIWCSQRAPAQPQTPPPKARGGLNLKISTTQRHRLYKKRGAPTDVNDYPLTADPSADVATITVPHYVVEGAYARLFSADNTVAATCTGVQFGPRYLSVPNSRRRSCLFRLHLTPHLAVWMSTCAMWLARPCAQIARRSLRGLRLSKVLSPLRRTIPQTSFGSRSYWSQR